ncbi:MAG: toprim domain-containing protein [Patescibacteria group bacterium]
MTDWVDFAEIRERVSLEQVLLEFYGLDNLRRDNAKLIGPCPVHLGDSKRAFHADLTKNVWHCFTGCHRGGNQLDLVALREGITIREAALKLKAFFHLDERGSTARSQQGAATARASPKGSSPSQSSTPPRRSSSRTDTAARHEHQRAYAESDGDDCDADGEVIADDGNTNATDGATASSTADTDLPINPPLDVVLNLKGDHPHLAKDRGLAPETIAHFGVGYCHRGIMRGCIAIPIHDEMNNLIAYAGRRLKPQDIRELGKYKLPKGFRKDRVLYNLNRVKDAMPAEGIVLVEGFFTVLKLHEAGVQNAVAAMGSELSDAQAQLLIDTPGVIILFDGDNAGRLGAINARDKLTALGITVRVANLPENTEPDDLSPKALRWLVNGMKLLDIAEVGFSFREPRAGASADTVTASPKEMEE